jgi:predicted Zn-dependent protease
LRPRRPGPRDDRRLPVRSQLRSGRARQIEAAQGALGELRTLAANTPADALGGFNALSDLLAVAQPVVAARIAASEAHNDVAIAQLEQAVLAEDKLSYNEPPDWFLPVRQLLGAQLLIAGRPKQAEQVFREDLKRNPANGWSLHGLSVALSRQGQSRRRSRTRARHARHLPGSMPDVALPAAAFWYARRTRPAASASTAPQTTGRRVVSSSCAARSWY